MKLIFPAFKKNIERNGLLCPGDTVLVGFSGGKDSVALIALLQELQKNFPLTVIAAYFNHGLRPDAGEEENWVRAFCAGRGIRLETGSRDLRRFKEENRLNLEHAASLSRYDFFATLAEKIPGARIATAHSRSDLCETFFIKLLRGSGLQGLSAIFASKERKIIRPLLIFSEDEILAFLGRNGLDFYQDSSNLGDDFLRNRIRHSLLPAVRAVEPEAEERIFRTVQLIQDEFDYFQELAHGLLRTHLLLDAVLPAKAFTGLHPALARHLAREYLRRLKGNLLGVGYEHIARFSKQPGDGTRPVPARFEPEVLERMDISGKGPHRRLSAGDRRRRPLDGCRDRPRPDPEKSRPFPHARRQQRHHGAAAQAALSPAPASGRCYGQIPQDPFPLPSERP